MTLTDAQWAELLLSLRPIRDQIELTWEAWARVAKEQEQYWRDRRARENAS